MDKQIGSKTIISSMIYKFVERIGSKLVGFIVSVLLARLLDPEVFGVLAILMAIVAIMQTFVDSGMGVALIQNKTTEEKDYSTVFYMTFGIAVIIYITVCFSAPYILSYFNMDGYEGQLRVLLVILLFYSFNSIQTAQLARGMKFKQIFICQLISIICSGVITIALALMGFGIWALVIHYVSNSIISCITYSYFTRWRPKLYFSIERAKIFFGYGIRMLASSLLSQLFAQIRTFAVGKVYSATDLAYYTRGDQVPNIISNTLDSVFRSVMLPVYASKQDQKKSLLNTLSKTVRLNSFMIFPAMCGLSAIAYSMVIIIYTDKWIGCVPFVQILSLANLAIPITSPCLVSIQAIGRSDAYFQLEVVRRVVMLIILAASFMFNSLIAIAIGWLISSYLDVVMVTWVAKRLLGYNYIKMFRDILPNLVISVIMFAAVYAVGSLNLKIGIIFVLQLIAGMVTYLLSAILFKNPNYNDFKKLIKKLVKKESAN